MSKRAFFAWLSVVTVLMRVSFSQTYYWGLCPAPPVQEDFNEIQFLGRWFEIERTFALFEATQRCVTSEYFLREDGKIGIRNTGVNAVGRETTIGGFALAPDPLNPAKLVVFLNGVPFATNLSVLHTDYYNFAVLWSCTGILGGVLGHTENMWILSRKPYLPEGMKNVLYQFLVQTGVGLKGLKGVIQSECPHREVKLPIGPEDGFVDYIPFHGYGRKKEDDHIPIGGKHIPIGGKADDRALGGKVHYPEGPKEDYHGPEVPRGKDRPYEDRPYHPKGGGVRFQESPSVSFKDQDPRDFRGGKDDGQRGFPDGSSVSFKDEDPRDFRGGKDDGQRGFRDGSSVSFKDEDPRDFRGDKDEGRRGYRGSKDLRNPGVTYLQDSKVRYRDEDETDDPRMAYSDDYRKEEQVKFADGKESDPRERYESDDQVRPAHRVRGRERSVDLRDVKPDKKPSRYEQFKATFDIQRRDDRNGTVAESAPRANVTKSLTRSKAKVPTRSKANVTASPTSELGVKTR